MNVMVRPHSSQFRLRWFLPELVKHRKSSVLGMTIMG